MADATFEKLIIGDVKGAHLSLSPNGIKMHEETGELRAELWMEYDGPALLMYDRNGQERLALFVENDGTPHIRVHDANGKKRISVSVDMEGGPLLQFLDGTGVALFQCTLIDGETPSLSFHSRDEKLRFHLLLHDDEADMLASPKTGEEHWGSLLRQLAKKGRA